MPQVILWSVKPLEDCWIGVCEPLKLAIESGTRGELLEDIYDATEAAIRSQEIAGTLTSRPERLRFDIPFIPSAADADTAEAARR